MEINFCRRCGAEFSGHESHVYTCANGHVIFLNSAPAVGIYFFTPEGKLVLARRGAEPHKGMLDTVGGFVDGEESLEVALEREIYEESGLTAADYDTPKYLTSASLHYEYKGEFIPVLSVFYTATLRPSAQPKPSDDVAEIVVTDIDDVDESQIGGEDIDTSFAVLKQRYKKESYERNRV